MNHALHMSPKSYISRTIDGVSYAWILPILCDNTYSIAKSFIWRAISILQIVQQYVEKVLQHDSLEYSVACWVKFLTRNLLTLFYYDTKQKTVLLFQYLIHTSFLLEFGLIKHTWVMISCCLHSSWNTEKLILHFESSHMLCLVTLLHKHNQIYCRF